MLLCSTLHCISYHVLLHLLFLLFLAKNKKSETLLIRPPSGAMVGCLINEMALLLKTLLMQPFNILALLLRFSKS